MRYHNSHTISITYLFAFSTPVGSTCVSIYKSLHPHINSNNLDFQYGMPSFYNTGRVSEREVAKYLLCWINCINIGLLFFHFPKFFSLSHVNCICIICLFRYTLTEWVSDFCFNFWINRLSIFSYHVATNIFWFSTYWSFGFVFHTFIWMCLHSLCEKFQSYLVIYQLFEYIQGNLIALYLEVNIKNHMNYFMMACQYTLSTSLISWCVIKT